MAIPTCLPGRKHVFRRLSFTIENCSRRLIRFDQRDGKDETVWVTRNDYPITDVIWIKILIIVSVYLKN